jgi:hypothetical protein
MTKQKTKIKIGWDSALQTYRQLMPGEGTVGTVIVPAKPNFSDLYRGNKT